MEETEDGLDAPSKSLSSLLSFSSRSNISGLGESPFPNPGGNVPTGNPGKPPPGILEPNGPPEPKGPNGDGGKSRISAAEICSLTTLLS